MDQPRSWRPAGYLHGQSVGLLGGTPGSRAGAAFEPPRRPSPQRTLGDRRADRDHPRPTHGAATSDARHILCATSIREGNGPARADHTAASSLTSRRLGRFHRFPFGVLALGWLGVHKRHRRLSRIHGSFERVGAHQARVHRPVSSGGWVREKIGRRSSGTPKRVTSERSSRCCESFARMRCGSR